MADRSNLSIPINLAFLAGLMAASQLTTAMAPMQPYSARAEMTAANPVASPPPTVEPVDDLSDGEPVMTLTAVAMPALPDVAVPEAPVADAPVQKVPAPPMPVSAVAAKPGPSLPTPMMPRQVGSTPSRAPPLRPDLSGPAPSNPPSIVPMEIVKPTALDPASPLSPESRSVAMAPTPMPPSQTGDRALLAPNRQRLWDAIPAEPPVGNPAVSSSAPDRLDSVTPRPATTAGLPQLVNPLASDLQAAGRLMDNAAQKLSLEFLWPADRRGHSRIYSRLTECLGVETGVIDGDGTVYVGTGGGRVFNAALHSPFMRLVDQPVDPRERRNIERIRSGRQFTAKDGTAVRVFRRAHDIRLLAALSRAFGGLPTGGRITAEYQIEAGALHLGKLTLNGRRHDGLVRLDQDSCI